MTLNNIKKMKNQKGFTIVELLIVIVIIGILAALVIVAYNGIQNRARATKAQTNAQAVAKKAEAYAADNSGAYPTLTTQFTGQLAALPAGVALAKTGAPAVTLSATTGETTVDYRACGSGAGYQVYYWDYSATTPAAVLGGSGGTTTSCATPAS